jgi:hypothetical protein
MSCNRYSTVGWPARVGGVLIAMLAAALPQQCVASEVDEPVAGTFRHWNPEAGTIRVDDREWRLAGDAAGGFEDDGRRRPLGALRPGTPVVLHPAPGTAGVSLRPVVRIERFEPRQ